MMLSSTTITAAALLVGNLLATVQSFGVFRESLSELSLENEDLIDGFDNDILEGLRLLSSQQRRAEQTISQQCIEDQTPIRSDPNNDFYDKFFEAGCVHQDLINNSTLAPVAEVFQDFTDCPEVSSEYRAYCDTNYQTVEYKDFRATCVISELLSETGEIRDITLTLYSYNSFGCEPISCPSDGDSWSSEDYVILSEGELLDANAYEAFDCDYEFLEKIEPSDSHSHEHESQNELDTKGDDDDDDDEQGQSHDHDHASHDEEMDTVEMESAAFPAATHADMAFAALLGSVFVAL